MKFNQQKSLAESVMARGLDLAESLRWRDHTVAIREGYKEKHGVSIPENVIATTATLLQNVHDYMGRMDETTRAVNLGSFVDYGFDVISATIPNLIAHEILSVQPMNAKHSAIFYLQYLYGSNKGNIAAGSTMNSPFTGQSADFHFSDEIVDGEVVGTGDGTTDDFTVSLGYTPVKTGTTQIFLEGTLVAQVTSTSNGTDTITAVGSSGITGTVVLDTGVLDLDAATAPALGASLTVKYRYDMDQTDVGFSQVDLDLKSISLEAHPRKLRARWLLDAAFELQKIKGIDAESELVIALSSEIKHEIDGELLSELYRLAGITGYTWSAQLPAGAAFSYETYKATLIDLFTEMSNDIFQRTKRVGANFIVAGVNVCTLIESLPAQYFVAAGGFGAKPINGPHLIGTLGGKWQIYKNPFYNPNNFLLGYRGASYLDAGYVYAPYMPLYATPTHVEDDFIFRKGLATSYGQVMLNNQLYAKGSITGFSAGRSAPYVETVVPSV